MWDVGDVTFSFADGVLLVSAKGFQVQVEAEGEWPSAITVAPGPFLKTLKKVPALLGIMLLWTGTTIRIGGRIVPTAAKCSEPSKR